MRKSVVARPTVQGDARRIPTADFLERWAAMQAELAKRRRPLSHAKSVAGPHAAGGVFGACLEISSAGIAIVVFVKDL
jgi:hypothetical protein